MGGKCHPSPSSRFDSVKEKRLPLYRKLGGLQGRCGQVQKISHPLGFDPLTVQLVASRRTDWAIQNHMLVYNLHLYNVRSALIDSINQGQPNILKLSVANVDSLTPVTKKMYAAK